MNAPHKIPQQALDICEQLVKRVYGTASGEIFCDAVHSGDRGKAIAILEELLSPRDLKGFPTGLKGLPSERLTAQRVIHVLEGQGPDFPSR